MSTINGTSGNDSLSGGNGSDVIDGRAGDDTLRGNDGNDSLFGGSGNDSLSGGNGADQIWGDSGAGGSGGGTEITITTGSLPSGVSVSAYAAGSSTANAGLLYQGGTSNGSGFGVTPTTGAWEQDPQQMGYNARTGQSESLVFNLGQDAVSASFEVQAFFANPGWEMERGVWEVYDNGVLVGSGQFDAYSSSGVGVFEIDAGVAFDAIRFSAISYGANSNDDLEDHNQWVNGVEYARGSSDYFVHEVSFVTAAVNVTYDDSISGGDGDDRLYGEQGDDTIYGDNGRDTIEGGDGNDKLYGGEGDDTISGGAGDDIIEGNNSRGYLSGDAGDDMITGGSSEDTITGGDGDDVLRGENSQDKIWGGEGDDTISGGDGDDSLYGDAGNDTITAGSGQDRVWGGDGDDTLDGGDGDDSVYGGAGNDSLSGGQGQDKLFGEDGDDTISGGNNDDSLYGGAGDDVLEGGENHDALYGGDGDDTLNGGASGDKVYGQDGADTGVFDVLTGEWGYNTYNGGKGTDTLVLRMTGSQHASFADQIEDYEAFASANFNVYSEDGPYFDFSFGLKVGDWEDLKVIVDGVEIGAVLGLFTENPDAVDFDTVASGSYEAGTQYDALEDDDIVWMPTDATQAGEAGFVPGTAFHANSGDDTITGRGLEDTIFGDDGDDVLSGGDNEDVLSGGDGEDTIEGNAGDDVIEGGAGDDHISGDTPGEVVEGGDSLLLSTADSNVDLAATVADWAAGGVTVEALRYNASTGQYSAADFGSKNVSFSIDSSHTANTALHGNYAYSGLAIAGGLDGGEIDTVEGSSWGQQEVLRLSFDAPMASVTVELSALFDGETANTADHGPFDAGYLEKAYWIAYGANGEVEFGIVEGTVNGLVNVTIDTDFDIVRLELAAADDGAGNSGNNSDFLLRSVQGETASGSSVGYDDTIEGNAGNDVIDGGAGDDVLYGDTMGGDAFELEVGDVEILPGDLPAGVTIEAYAAGASNPDSGILYASDGKFGVSGDTTPGEPDDQLGFDPQIDSSETLRFSLGGDASSAAFSVSSLFHSGGEHERGVWTVYDDGVAVGNGIFEAESGANIGSFTIDVGAVFDEIRFTATTYGADANPNLENNGLDSSDYFLTALSYSPVVSVDFDDTIDGGEGEDLIVGGIGEDTLFGGNGDDVIYGDEISTGGGSGGGGSGSGSGHHGSNNHGSGSGSGHHGSNNHGSGGGSGHQGSGSGSGHGGSCNSSGSQQGTGHGDNPVGFDDYLDGGAGNDTLFGQGGNDVLTGGSGDDHVDGGTGDDTGIYDLRDNAGATDFYEGGQGTDTIILRMTAGQFATYQSEIEAYEDFVTANYDITSQDGPYFTFSFGLTLGDWENVVIDVDNLPPQAQDDVVVASEDGPGVTIDVLGNDDDPNGDALTVTGVDTTGVEGDVTINPDGTIGYNPNGGFETLAEGETAIETFTYTVSDPGGATSIATVTVTVNGENDAPDAADDTGSVSEDGTTTINVLGNDSDPDASDTLTVAGIDTTGMTGTASLNPDGTVIYDPAGGFEDLGVGETAIETFTYTVSDGHGGTDIATVTVTVTGTNDGPVAQDDTGSVSENGSGIVIDVLANDSDVDASDVLTVVSIDTAGTSG